MNISSGIKKMLCDRFFFRWLSNEDSFYFSRFYKIQQMQLNVDGKLWETCSNDTIIASNKLAMANFMLIYKFFEN